VQDILPHLSWIAVFHTALALGVSAHAVLYKRDTRAVIGWVGIIWLTPVIGSFLYAVLGVNRIHRRAHMLRGKEHRGGADVMVCPQEIVGQRLGDERSPLRTLATLVGEISDRRLTDGNIVEPLVNGDEAYPAMLDSIRAAKHSVSLSTYIFGNDPLGHEFVEALRQAQDRGVVVRVLIDDVGSRYSRPTIVGRLQKQGVPVRTFMPTPGWFRYSNLRNHRKLLVVDGHVGFTGGMNIKQDCQLATSPKYPTLDMHFRIEGPVVTHIQEVFVFDWQFATGEELSGSVWFPEPNMGSGILARGIADGPDEDFDCIRLVILGAIGQAQASINIVTPYFLPDQTLITALNLAAMRGVEVNIILPAKNNLFLVQWASTAQLWQLLDGGCRVWLSPEPFDHTKLMLVDGNWTCLGSANWDPRSLRLNFEFNIECYDPLLSERLGQIVQAKLGASRRVESDELNSRSLVIKLRDGIARLASPYL